MPSQSRTRCQDGGESDERQEHKKGPMVQEQVRAGGASSPVAGRRRISSGSRKSPGKSLAKSRSFRQRDSSSHHRRNTPLEGEQESTSQMKRNHSLGRQLNLSNSSHRRLGEQDSTPQMKRIHSLGGQLHTSNSSHRRRGELASTPQMRRNHSFGRQLNTPNSSSHHSPHMRRNHSFGRQLSSHHRTGEIESTPQMKRNHSFGRQLDISNGSNSSHRRSNNKSTFSKKDLLLARNGSGASQTRDRTGRRKKNKQTVLRASAACDLGTAQVNVFQTLERGLHCQQKQSLEHQSDISESSRSLNPATSNGIGSSKIPLGETSAQNAVSKRNTEPGLDKPKEATQEPVKRSSDPVKLELDDGVQPRPGYGRRFSWWNLPSSSDLGDLEVDEDDDDLPPQVVPPSRRSSIMAEEEKPKKSSSINPMSTPKQSKKAGRRSTGQKKSLRTKSSFDSMDSALTQTTDAESGSWQADSSGELLSPTTQKAPIDEDLVSPLPSIPRMKRLDKQLSSGTCTTESSSCSGSSVKKSKEHRSKKSKRRKSAKEGVEHNRTAKADAETKDAVLEGIVSRPIQDSPGDHSIRSTKRIPEASSHSQTSATRRNNRGSMKEGSKRNVAEKEDLDGSRRGPVRVSLEDHFNCSKNQSFNRSMNRSCDFSFCSRGSTTKRSVRKSMSIKQSNMDASRSSMSVSLSDDQDDVSIGSDFEGSVDFDFEEEDMNKEPSAPGVEILNGEDSFQILGDDSKHKSTRSMIKGKTQRSSGGNSHSGSIQRNRRSATLAPSKKGIAVMEM
ncbi:unnamed protein product [Cylindrotheca closterium]|uniref:Uncharacterized protein n=1 Tax=Cylindrotheca closterium TaxID=2856 RepID=A0AAD2JJ22_9STRA|nr:unnamed protein product [Cylindrotheca closterium]